MELIIYIALAFAAGYWFGKPRRAKKTGSGGSSGSGMSRR